MKAFKNKLILIFTVFFVSFFSVNAQEFRESEMNFEICGSISHKSNLHDFCFKRVLIISKYIGMAFSKKYIFQNFKNTLIEEMSDEFEGGILPAERYYLSSSSDWKEYVNTSKSLMNIYKTAMKFRSRRVI